MLNFKNIDISKVSFVIKDCFNITHNLFTGLFIWRVCFLIYYFLPIQITSSILGFLNIPFKPELILSASILYIIMICFLKIYILKLQL